jgi:hypothetical protein
MRTISALVIVAGCGSVTQYQSADPVGARRWQGMAAAGLGSFKDDPQQSKTPTANLEVGARYGITQDVDVGLKLFTAGIEASVRARVRERGTGAWSVALLAAANSESNNTASAGNDAAILAQLRLGAVATRHSSPRWGWNLGLATTGSVFVPAGGGHATGVLLGVYGGFAWRFRPKWQWIPELSIHRSIAGDVPVDGSVVELGSALARDF